jgi:hypothetical protein
MDSVVDHVMLNDVIAAYGRHCRALREAEITKLGVAPELLKFNSERKLFQVMAGAVLFSGPHFEFDPTGTHSALIFVCLDEDRVVADLAAWKPSTKQLGLWLGRVTMLGEENVLAPHVGESLRVHDTPLEWLQDDRRGVVLIDAPGSLQLLYAASPISVSSFAVRSALMGAWRTRFPDIRVRA